VGSSPFSLVDQARFRAGFDFLRLRAQVGEVEEELAHWWETFQSASDEMRDDMIDAQRRANLAKPGGPGTARRVKRSDADHPVNAPAPDPRFRPVAGAEDGDEDEGSEEGGPTDAVPPDGTAPAKKRRRRRRKPTGAPRAEGGGGGGDGPGEPG
jgi:poly(A) polymerase